MSGEEKVTFTRAGALLGVRRTLPVAVSSAAFGFVLGVLARGAGLSLLEMVLMSALVFAGASQLIAVGLWASPLPVWTIILTTLVVNLRHLLLGAALRPWFARLSAPKAYGSLYFLVDETWALLMQEFRRGGRDAAFLMGSGLTLFVAWVSSSAAGQMVGAAISERDLAEWGLDFVFTAVFTALLVGMWKSKSDLLPWGVAAGVALLTWWLLPGTNWYILLGGLAGSVAGAVRNAA